MGFDDVHEDLKALKQFCVRVKKQPYIHDGPLKNSFTSIGWTERRNDWLTFTEAVDALQRCVKVYHSGEYQSVDGIGFLIVRSSQGVNRPLGGDLDCCRDPVTGIISPWATTFIQTIQPFYTEISPSKCGLRFFVWGHLPNDVDKVFGHGPQDGLPEAAKEAILETKPDARKKLAKGSPVFNGLELYESGRHLTITGDRLEEGCFSSEDQTRAISDALQPFFEDQAMENVAKDMEKQHPSQRGRLPQLDILDVIDTAGFAKSGSQLWGPHPTLGSSTGRNLVVNPGENVYCFMHDGINAGGDAWIWLACECGAVPWKKAGSGVLKDRYALKKTLEYAVSKGLISRQEAGLERERKATSWLIHYPF